MGGTKSSEEVGFYEILYGYLADPSQQVTPTLVYLVELRPVVLWY